MTTHDLLDDVIIRLARCDRVELQAVSAFVHGIETARNGSGVASGQQGTDLVLAGVPAGGSSPGVARAGGRRLHALGYL